MAGGGSPQLPQGLVPVEDTKAPALPKGLVPVDEKKKDIGNASSQNYQPTSQDLKTKASFDSLENSFDHLPPTPGTNTPGFKPLVQTQWKPTDLAAEQAASQKRHAGQITPQQQQNFVQKQAKGDHPLVQTPEKDNGGKWSNLPTFTSGTVFGGLEKDAGDLIKYGHGLLGDLLGVPGLSKTSDVVSQSAYDASKKDLDEAQKNPLPNTALGRLVSGVANFTPDLIELANTPELEIAKMGKLGEAITKYGGKYGTKAAELATGKFPIQQSTKGFLNAYGDAKKAGKSDEDANIDAAKGFLKGYGTGIAMDVGADVAHGMTGLGTKALEDAGLMSDNKFVAGTEKRLLHATAQGLTFSAIPFVQNAIEGKDTNLQDVENSGLFGAVLGGIAGGHSEPGEPTNADKAAAQVIARSPLIDMNNFMESDLDAITKIHTDPISAADLHAKSIASAEDGFNAPDDETKQHKAVASSIAGKAASVKSVTDAILKDKDAVIDGVNELPLPDDKKQAIIDKINQVHKELDPTEQKKTEMGRQISELDQKIKVLSEKTDDPVKNAENEVNLEQAEKQREELNNKLKKTIQNEKENTEVKTDEEKNGRPGQQVAERPEIVQDGEEKGRQGVDEKHDVKQGAENAPLKTEEDAVQEQKTESVPVQSKAGDSEEVPSGNAKGQEIADEGQKEVKKTILTKRAYEGEIQPEVKKYLEDKGLRRKSFSQAERSKQAEDFIDKFGEDATYHAIKNGDIDGALASSALAKLIKRNSRLINAEPDNADLAKKQADYIDLQEQKGYAAGEYVGQLAHEYQDEELGYANVKKQVQESTGSVSPEQEKKIKELTEKNKTLESQLSEHEQKLINATDEAFNKGRESVKNESSAAKAKRLADKVRAAKVHRPGVFSAATPASLAWDGAVEVVAKSIETGGKVADAIQKGLDHIKETDWYKGLSKPKQQEAEDEFKKFHHDNTGSSNLEDLQSQFADKKGNKFTPDEARSVWNYMKERYLETGNNFSEAISKTSRDLGLSWRQVSEAITTPKVKRVSDEMWKKQSELARQRTAIRAWIGDQNSSAPVKAFKKVANAFRGVAVFGHGGIFIGTHAGGTLFNPQTWNKTIPAFIRGWKYAYGNEANYAKGMEELKNSPNYLLAQRAGLKNEPERIDADEYQKAQHYLGKLGLAGERGFNAIKVLRQDLFDYHYNKLTPEEKSDPDVAKSVAKLVNLATGATTLKIPGWVNELTFAGGMEAARWQKLLQSPAKSAEILGKVLQGKATPAEKVFVKIWAERVGTQVATYTSLLAANAALQHQLNPNNPVNFTDPDKPDFGKFKLWGTSIDPSSGMRGTGMFLKTLATIPFKKEQRGETRTQTYGKKLLQYGRGKLSPFYGTVADAITSRDYSGNVLPYSKDKPGKYNHKLGYAEYGSSKLPLPVAESFEVFYKSALDHGASKPVLNAIVSGIISGTTGFRVTDDEPKKKNTYTIKAQ